MCAVQVKQVFKEAQLSNNQLKIIDDYQKKLDEQNMIM